MSQFFLKEISLSIYTHPIASVSLQSPNPDFDNESSLKEQNFKNEFLNWFWGFLNWLCNLSMGFSRQEYWSVLPFPSPGDLPDQGTEPQSPTVQADSLPSETPEKYPPVSKH